MIVANDIFSTSDCIIPQGRFGCLGRKWFPKKGIAMGKRWLLRGLPWGENGALRKYSCLKEEMSMDCS
jgi:hypothetical protein